ncbi:MAG: hypothetical protein ABI361_12960 [Nitrososphaera sp.]|jgi:hypothetical protein
MPLPKYEKQRLKNKNTLMASSAIGLLLLLSLATGTGGNISKAFAMGQGPSCDNTYAGTVTGLTISNGTTTVDVLKNPKVMDVYSGKTYDVSLTMQSASKSAQNNTSAGNIWIDEDIANYFNGVCVPVSGANTSVTQTITASAPFSAGFLQNASICVNYPSSTCESWQIQWTAPTSSTTYQLTVNAWDFAGNQALNGYYTVLYQNGAVANSGFTPATFNLNANQQYIVEPQDYGQYVFDHWGVDGSTARDRVVTPTSDQVLQADYRNVNSPPPGSNLVVNSVDSSNNPLTGYYTVLYQNGAVVNSGFTPATFETTSSQQYTVEVQDFGSYHFDHWQDNGSTNRERTFIAPVPQQMLTAVYSTGSSGGGGSGTTSQLSVQTFNAAGSEINGYYVTLWQNGNVIASGFSPTSFTINNNQQYQVAVADYGSESFNHWEGGSADRMYPVDITGSASTSVIAHAYYSP